MQDCIVLSCGGELVEDINMYVAGSRAILRSAPLAMLQPLALMAGGV